MDETTSSQPSTATLERLLEFIDTERSRFSDRDNNVFATCLSQVARYYQFLLLILEPYRSLSQRLVRIARAHLDPNQPRGSHPMTPADLERMRESAAVNVSLQLQIESFYLFSKLLLDQVARSIQFYFGPARGCSLGSHDKLTKRIEAYASAKALTIPDEFVALAARLKSDIADFRDYQVAHLQNPRMIHGIHFDGRGRTGLMLSPMYPADRDATTLSIFPEAALDDIDAYIKIVEQLLSSNRDRTTLAPRA